MKKLSKVLVLVLSAIMVLAMSASVFAAEGTITITPPENATGTNTYTIYKVFDAVASEDGSKISYKVMSGKDGVPDVAAQMESGYDAATIDHFIIDSAGNVHYGTERVVDGKTVITDSTADELSEAAIKAVAAYIDGDDPVDTATSTGTEDAVSGGLENGYYYVATSTGALVTITSTKPNAEVEDKNTLTVPEKIIYAVQNPDGTVDGAGSLDSAGKNALAQLGSKVTYHGTITSSKSAKNYVFHDVMGAGLTYNNDVKVIVAGEEVSAGNNTFNTTTAEGDTLTVTFVDSYVQGLAEGTEITIEYTATVNSDALTVETGKNTASLSYGDNNSSISVPVPPHVYNAKITVDKKDGEGNALAGAGFVLMNADGKFYKKTAEAITWVDTVETADVLTTEVVDGVAQIQFTGLADGTYTLHEEETPAGYNSAADQTITINPASNSNFTTDLALEAEVINESGAVLPGTGGIGTTIFYILGSALVIGCGIVLISRKRMQNK